MKPKYAMAGKLKTIDEFLANLRKDKRAMLKKLRKTIRFQPHNPLPTALVRKLVKARIIENGG